MKKFFSFCAAMLVALAANAAVINITPTSPQPADNLRLALASASAGDVIVMGAGTYEESNGNFIAFDKNITVKAADGAEVIVQPRVSSTISNGARAEIIGIKWDASHLRDLATWYEHVFYASDATAGNRLIFEGCEFYGFSLNNSYIFCSAANKLDSVNVNNCYFHNITKSCLYFENPDMVGLTVTNSTFANIAQGATDSYYAGNIFAKTELTTVNVLVDHCTFYNIETMNTDYGAVKVKGSNNSVVSNCVFMMPASYSNGRAVYNKGGTVSNCITYNYAKDSGTGLHSGPTITNCTVADPLFVNAAAGDFTLGEGSPALTAAADGGAIGDPRWVPAPSLPYMAIIGEMNNWAGTELVPDSAQLTASCTIHLDMNQNSGYGFKVLIGSTAYCIQPGDQWYAFHRGWTSASGIDHVASESEAFWLQIDMAGDYGFKWTMAEKKLEITFPELPTHTLYFVNNMGWEHVYAYAWDPQIAEWPGEQAQLTEMQYGNYPIYGYTLPVNRQHIIFNDGTGGDGHQTADLTVNAATPFYFNGTWYASLSDLPTNIDVIKAEPKAQKFVENGQIVIRKGDKAFTILGTELKK